MTQPTIRRIAVVASAAARWCDADFPPRVRATREIERRTGYSEPVVDFALDALFGSLDRETLAATFANELGSLDALVTFVQRPHRSSVRYVALERAAIVSSDSTIGVAIPALVYALCAGCEVAVKDRDDGLVAAFVATLVEEEPDLRERIVTQTWDGATDDRANDAFFSRADVVVAYGGDAALADIRSRARPTARFVGYGHRTSVGYVPRETLDDADATRAAATGLARDALLYDGDGCLSVHAVFVEAGARTSVADFARALEAACDTVAIEFPAGFAERDPAVVAYYRAALFRAAQGAGAVHPGAMTPGTVRADAVRAEVVAPHVVVLDPPRDEPPPLLRRTLAIYGVAGPADAEAFLHRHRIPLEGIAIATDARADVVAFASATGASYVARYGELQRPPLGGEHGGHGRILPFVRAIYRP